MGPLNGIRLIEIAGIGPGPMAAMMLGDMGADVIRVDRLNPKSNLATDPRYNVHGRSRRSIAVDLQKKAATEVILRLVEKVDGLMEPFRPGVAERLGIGPAVAIQRNPKLVYGRMTGWGQDGPLANAAGHDINYIALSGVLHAIGPQERPMPPLNLVGDYGGGAMLLAFGMVCGLLEATRSGQGQVIDAAMVDGTAALFGHFAGMDAAGLLSPDRESNMLDGGAHFYGTYATKDCRFICIGSIEPQFYSLLLEKIGLLGQDLPDQMDRKSWPAMRSRLEAIFLTKTRDEWCGIMEGTDVCFAPVLSVAEAPHHAHAKARDLYIDVSGVKQPRPAPRFSRTPGQARVAPKRGESTTEVLSWIGFSRDEIAELRKDRVVG
ncbi:CoA transferase [Bradyrhizobium diazoefficiens]|nr:CaiB/BaiF CoA-transferase family protein [Bradyrhizobium diazoefficiens]MBR0967336.1 CoA transferase [Bradyrhizobium diazoefficiens]MBR0976657.1 CoA transferase [Bradyrhizobium diazoefficiens]MBR1005302.1 CoA transferase [Bradyrhizobium diazoefficiens]MBR1011775.1 CoA transferase [Bradyrhizobium diazoefficiens]MBR1049116.1 CoA transferase [Bradyrhizobium diazoefficiens]